MSNATIVLVFGRQFNETNANIIFRSYSNLFLGRLNIYWIITYIRSLNLFRPTQKSIIIHFHVYLGRLNIAENWNDVTIALLVIVALLLIGFIVIVVYLFRYKRRISKYDLDS